jgi:hypothetical protein
MQNDALSLFSSRIVIKRLDPSWVILKLKNNLFSSLTTKQTKGMSAYISVIFMGPDSYASSFSMTRISIYLLTINSVYHYLLIRTSREMEWSSHQRFTFDHIFIVSYLKYLDNPTWFIVKNISRNHGQHLHIHIAFFI